MRQYELGIVIIKRLSILSTEVSLRNSVYYTDINKACEDFYCKLLNFVYGYELVNINKDEENAVAIDLGDKKRRIAIQVTSEKRLDKSKRTLKKFVQNELYKDYDRLIILQIVKKIKHSTPNISEDSVTLDTQKDIIDIYDLGKDIKTLDTKILEELWELIKYETSSLLDEADFIKRNDIFQLSQCLHSSFRPDNLVDFFPDTSTEIINFLTSLKATPRYLYEEKKSKNNEVISEKTICALVEEIIKSMDEIKDNKQQNTDTNNIKYFKHFIVAPGGSGKTVTIWNTCKYINDNIKTIFPIYLNLGDFDSIEQIDQYFLKIGNISFTELLKKKLPFNLILLLDSWDEFTNNCIKQEYNILLSLIERFPIIVAGRYSINITKFIQY